ncbi:MAG: hypothetical protein K2R98_03420 [Gemmataceae bacterium]|nr:hypothetical protein [Gemmataceae bacterium]
MNPFTYPATAHVRRHGPQGYADLDSFRPWLRDEFSFRCVYCLLREQWAHVRGLYAIDHFRAVTHHPEQAQEYDNLLHACAGCNVAKGARDVPDPLLLLTSPAVQVSEDGTIHADNPNAAHLIELLGLDSERFAEFRMLWIGIATLAARHDSALHGRLMGYPADLPDLTALRAPGGNTRPEGIAQSCHVQRQNGTLPETY